MLNYFSRVNQLQQERQSTQRNPTVFLIHEACLCCYTYQVLVIYFRCFYFYSTVRQHIISIWMFNDGNCIRNRHCVQCSALQSISVYLLYLQESVWPRLMILCDFCFVLVCFILQFRFFCNKSVAFFPHQNNTVWCWRTMDQ